MALQLLAMAAVVAAAVVDGLGGSRLELGVGLALGLAGLALVGWCIATIGPTSPLPRPLGRAQLARRGPYAIVRHPMYTGVVMIFAGVALAARSVVALVSAGFLAVVLALKARVEERWLHARFPSYDEYARRVRARFLPRPPL